MGSLPIRQRATIAGNIVNASPIGDMTIALLALDAEIGLVAGEGHRSLPLRDFFLGYKDLDLELGELVEWVRFRGPGERRPLQLRKGEQADPPRYRQRQHRDVGRAAGRPNSRLLAFLPAVSLRFRCSFAAPANFLTGRVPDIETALAAAEMARSEVRPDLRRARYG